MAIFPLFKKKEYFSAAEKERIVEAIRLAEMQTSGEIRIYVEGKNPFMDAVDRASEVFHKLKMENTEHRNAVLLYVAMKHRELAVFGDTGIYAATGKDFWNNVVKKMIANFSKKDICTGMVQCIGEIGQALKEKFPFNGDTDKNELPDEIVFGK